jgi:hypothetical protein
MIPEREKELKEIIDYEIIVDCYGDWEVESSWEIYLEENLEFPFKAKAEIKQLNGNLKIKNIEAIDFAGLNLNQKKFYLDMRLANSENIFQISASKIKSVFANDEVKEVFEVWKFWSDKY